jgi:hypothetical protein
MAGLLLSIYAIPLGMFKLLSLMKMWPARYELSGVFWLREKWQSAHKEMRI